MAAGPAAGAAGAGPRSSSPDWSRSATPTRKVWRITERPIPEACDEEGPPLQKGDEEMEKEAPLEKGMDDKVGEVEMKEEEPVEKEGAQGGVEMKEETPLEKGEGEMKGTSPCLSSPSQVKAFSSGRRWKGRRSYGGLPQHPGHQ